LYVCISALFALPTSSASPNVPNHTSTPLRPPAHTSCHQRCALCIETVIWSSLDLCRLPPRPPDYTHISTTTLYVSCRRRPHDLHLYLSRALDQTPLHHLIHLFPPLQARVPSCALPKRAPPSLPSRRRRTISHSRRSEERPPLAQRPSPRRPGQTRPLPV
jgi:hypothetical protein